MAIRKSEGGGEEGVRESWQVDVSLSLASLGGVFRRPPDESAIQPRDDLSPKLLEAKFNHISSLMSTSAVKEIKSCIIKAQKFIDNIARSLQTKYLKLPSPLLQEKARDQFPTPPKLFIHHR